MTVLNAWVSIPRVYLRQASAIFWSQSASKIFHESDDTVMEVESGRLLPTPEGVLLLRVRLG